VHGRPVSFATFALVVDFIARIPVVIILGAGTYLTVIWNADPKVFGAVVMRGDHCDLEHPAERNDRRHLPDARAGRAGVVTVLGIAHPKNWNSLIYPMADHANGGLIPGSLHGGARADRRGHVLLQRVRQRG